MEQIEQLLELLKSTPEMALWGLFIWCMYILLKLSSVVYAVKVVFQKAIEKWHDYKVKELELKSKEIDQENIKLGVENQKKEVELIRDKTILDNKRNDLNKLAKRFDKIKINSVEYEELIKLLDAVKGDSMYIHQSNIDNAIKKLK